jgi:mRNA interferase RelE/StbE
MEQAVLRLENDPRPRGARKLQGTDTAYRVRVGDYRVVYEVIDSAHLVIILAARRRAENTYRGL